ncbi:MAG TPA: hypothetical protein VHR55_00625 [Candidatus Limnocylindria bacterium]|nr:hypothetical protein [Candidatus Limnocylindria bacterium]
MSARLAGLGRRSEWAEPVLFGLVAFVVYWVTGPSASGDVWPPLAEAFANGRLHLVEDRPWLELVPRAGGGQYVPLPPVPALTLLPFVPFGELDGNVYGSIVGGLNVALAWWLLAGWGVAPSPRRWLVVGFAGTTHWWVAGMAGPHHYAQLCGVLFTLLALNLAVRGRWPMAAGLLLGLAAGSRLPMGLALPVLLGLYGGGWRPHRSWLPVLAGLALPALAVAWYNVARFGSPFDFGYARIPSGEHGLVTDEPWFRDGILSITYIPRHIEVMLFELPDLVPQPPWLRPNLSGMSLLLTGPFLFLAFLARGRHAGLLWIGVALVLAPDFLHGSWGFAQFGYRFILDAVPLLLLLLGLAYRERASWVLIATILVGIAVHAYGIWAITVLGFYT